MCNTFKEEQEKYGRLYNVWKLFRQRCNNPNNKDYSRYGGSGIKVCEEWNSFRKFNEDMLPSFIEGLTLDRRDNNLNYNKENCHWVTHKKQCRNRRTNIVYKGKCGIEWAEYFGVPRYTITNKVKYWGTLEKAVLRLEKTNPL